MRYKWLLPHRCGLGEPCFQIAKLYLDDEDCSSQVLPHFSKQYPLSCRPADGRITKVDSTQQFVERVRYGQRTVLG